MNSNFTMYHLLLTCNCKKWLTLWLRLWLLMAIWKLHHWMPVSRIFMRQKVMNRIMYVQITIFIKTILESLFKVLLGPYILVAPTWLAFFFNGRWVLSNFWHLDCYNFCDILRKNAKLYFLEASHWPLKTCQKSYP